MAKTFFSWREAILKSELPSTTRHVLLTLSCHMNDAGESCYPSIERLCTETGLSNRTVINHLMDATNKGWIVTRKQGLSGQSWFRNSYSLSWKAVNLMQEGSELLTQGSESLAEGSEPDDRKAVKEVHISTSCSTSISTSNKYIGFESFWDAYPKGDRKQGKSKCLEIWKRKNLESKTKEILEHLEYHKDVWQKDGNRFVPMTQTYLNKEGWDGWEKDDKSTFDWTEK